MKNLFLIIVIVISLGCKHQAGNKIVIYGSEKCNHCIQLKDDLDSAGMQYTFYDLDVNREKELEMIDKLKKYKIRGNVSIPVLDLNGKQLIIGADFKKLQRVLKSIK
tara:strand:+ start:2228 stop:2548 length:321 start_codon:yes stop_codon:yes gene_type:complete